MATTGLILTPTTGIYVPQHPLLPASFSVAYNATGTSGMTFIIALMSRSIAHLWNCVYQLRRQQNEI